MNSKKKIIRLFSGFILLFALLVFQGSSPGKSCYNCNGTAPVTFTNNTGIEIYLAVHGAKSNFSWTLANNAKVVVSLSVGSYHWVAYSDFVIQNGQVSGDVVRTGQFAVVTDTTPVAVAIQ